MKIQFDIKNNICNIIFNLWQDTSETLVSIGLT